MNYLTVRPRNGSSMLSDFDRLFESVFTDKPGWNDRSPAVDIRSREDAYVIDADLPGMSEEQIDVRVENDLLVISGREEKEVSKESSDGDEFLLRERTTRQFHRSFALPKDADAGNVEASYRNGVLTVVLNKKPESKPRQIRIKRG